MSIPFTDTIEKLAYRYKFDPDVIAEWPFIKVIRLYYASIRNEARERLLFIFDRVSSNEISAPAIHYDEKGKEIKGGGRVDPIGFNEHIKMLQTIIGEHKELPKTKQEMMEEKQREAGKVAKNFFGQMMKLAGKMK